MSRIGRHVSRVECHDVTRPGQSINIKSRESKTSLQSVVKAARWRVISVMVVVGPGDICMQQPATTHNCCCEHLQPATVQLCINSIVCVTGRKSEERRQNIYINRLKQNPRYFSRVLTVELKKRLLNV